MDLPFTLMFLGFIGIIGGAVAWVYVLLLPAALVLGVLTQWRLRGLLHNQLSRSNERQGLLVDSIRCRVADDPPYLFYPLAREWLQAGAERINLRKTYALVGRVGRYLQDLDGPLDANLALEDLLIDLTRLSR